MTQLTLTKSNTPRRIVIELEQDPYDEEAATTVTARVRAVDGSLLSACSVSLRGLEIDCIDSVVGAAVTCFRWGAPQSQLMSMMRYQQKQARAHARKHERS